MEPSVSLITATFNRRELLPRVVRSLQLQTLKSFEWIIVDDGSTDDTYKYLKSLRDPRIKIIKQSNQGCNAARNRGELEINAEFVVYIDSDDELAEPDTLQKMVDRIRQTPISIGGIAFAVLSPDRITSLSSIEHDGLLIDYKDLLCGRRVKGDFFRIYKKSATKIAPWPSKYAGMEVLKHLAIAKKFKVLYVREPGLIYHQNHGENITSAKGTITRATSMAEGYEHLISEYKSDFLSFCPKALGLNLFHLAMYSALAGSDRKAFKYSIRSLRANGPWWKNILLVASLSVSLSIRHAAFTWRSSLKGKS